MEIDIRWKQRFSNFKKALNELTEAVSIGKVREFSKLEKQGLIQGFEYTHELAWNCLKDYIEYQGPAEVKGSRDATREAFKIGLIKDGDNWMQMIRSRNLTSHTYNKEVADELVETIVNNYYQLYLDLETELTKLLK